MLKVKYRMRNHFPVGTVITGNWSGSGDKRTIYKNRLQEGMLRWSEVPGGDRLTHSWSLCNIEIVRMGNESEMESKEGG